MSLAPYHIQEWSPSENKPRWVVNQIYSQDPRGAEAAYAAAQNAGGTGGNDSDDKMFSFLDKAADKQFGYQKGLMGLTNEYRTKEGATQGQMDEQAHRRLTTQVSSQQFMQRQGSDLAEKAKQNDSGRAIRAFKGNF